MMKPLDCIVIASGLFCLLAAFLLIMSLNPAVGKEIVIASTYNDGTRDPNGNTVAHKTLPFGTRLTLKHSHRTLMVTVNDRGPWVRGRTLDLTPAVNKYLRCYGLCRVVVEPWPPLPREKPKPNIETAIIWGEE